MKATKAALAVILPGASAYWGISSRRLARKMAGGQRTGLVIGCRMPPTTQRGTSTTPGWERVRAVVNGRVVGEFWDIFKKSPHWVDVEPGEVRVEARSDGPPPSPLVSFTLEAGQVRLVEIYPELTTGPRLMRPARIDVVDDHNSVIATSTRP